MRTSPVTWSLWSGDEFPIPTFPLTKEKFDSPLSSACRAGEILFHSAAETHDPLTAAAGKFVTKAEYPMVNAQSVPKNAVAQMTEDLIFFIYPKTGGLFYVDVHPGSALPMGRVSGGEVDLVSSHGGKHRGRRSGSDSHVNQVSVGYHVRTDEQTFGVAVRSVVRLVPIERVDVVVGMRAWKASGNAHRDAA